MPPFSKFVTLTTAQMSLRWEGPRLELESGAGVSVSRASRPQRWLRASGGWWFTRAAAFVVSASTRPPDVFRLDAPIKPCVTAALRLASAPGPDSFVPLLAEAQVIDWDLRPLGGGRYVLDVRAPHARAVEVMGDMTGWSPTPLRQCDSELWTVVLAMSPGVHQMNLRLDGGPWVPPPGAPAISDGFNGAAGVLVAE